MELVQRCSAKMVYRQCGYSVRAKEYLKVMDLTIKGKKGELKGKIISVEVLQPFQSQNTARLWSFLIHKQWHLCIKHQSELLSDSVLQWECRGITDNVVYSCKTNNSINPFLTEWQQSRRVVKFISGTVNKLARWKKNLQYTLHRI